ncbi:trypsin-like serine peptidase [Sandaracinus amylolyticus]|uniref:Putative lipoprotein n=1 Tax=Sandaracinus amylolyticus TaxID=927083 RepID=A0A0F6W258_9BACT|nr:trypsin-like serine protease [Sandaracinus amylolyticus]AKF05492.1 putative lipoprotein [Sandaracinus amylolyticus]
MKRYVLSMLIVTLAGCAARGNDAAPEPELDAPAVTPVEVVLPEDLEPDEALTADIASLRDSLGEMTTELGFGDDADSRIVVRYRGRGEVVSGDDAPFEVEYGDSDDDATVADDPDFATWVAVHLQTGNEFEVRFPRDVLHAADDRAHERGIDRGTREPVSEASERPTVPFVEDDAALDPTTRKGWSNAQDTRTLRGTIGVAHTDSAHRRLVSLGTNGGCSGTLVGPKHIVTAAHCIRNFTNGTWRGTTAYAGRSGPSAWRSSAPYNPNPDVAATWYWVPGNFMALSDGLADMPYSATPWDIGVIVTHASRLGETVGWMGWYWWGDNGEFANRTRFNRGYPVCGAVNAPASCQRLGLYGDTQACNVGEHSSTDADGIERRFRFSCDMSGGHSGSSLYSYLDSDTVAVTGVVSWEHCFTCGGDDDRPNTGVRITREYSGIIASLRQSMP